MGGFVRNLSDGRVETAFEGEPDSVDAMVEWCRRGPPSARVQGIEIIEEQPSGDSDFNVTR